eukprot:CAMPEP_0206251756 /NCGR_PEP_ID=MMETSP0047_2-20121206/22199_1 /ASSEMBLY_ACC=CAM_ASM_000192 /TAXON_ID=195065 /ORGANISM="Chroomonas mesostigmatica_cf, Strain CCMP1168" /LENGTH=333 /DNA_ID=CAMNT_0053677741 /DNA_START=62 /DNA_END=1063 /DNA_ORIENTATION=+
MASPNSQSSSTLSRRVGLVALSALSSLVCIAEGFQAPALGFPAISRRVAATSAPTRRGALGHGMVATRPDSSDYWLGGEALDLGEVFGQIKRALRGDEQAGKLERASGWKEEREQSLLEAYKASLAEKSEQSAPSVEAMKQETTALAILASRRVKGEELCLACMAQAEKLHAELLKVSSEASVCEGFLKTAKKSRAEGIWKEIQRCRSTIEATVRTMAEAEESIRAFQGISSPMETGDEEAVSVTSRQAKIMARLQLKRDKIVELGSKATPSPRSVPAARKRDRIMNTLSRAKDKVLQREQEMSPLSVHQMNREIREITTPDYEAACDAAWTA